MKKAKIRLAFRIVIDSASTMLWDKYVFVDTHREYKMQQQLFNSKDIPKATFRELLAENEKAEQLHYLSGLAANTYVQQLKGKLHRVSDVLGNQFFPFVNYRMDIVNTDINDISKHRIGMTFYSPPLILIEIVNSCYLVSTDVDSEKGCETLMFAFQPNLAICYHEDLE